MKRVGKGASKFKWSKAQCGTTYYFQIRPLQKVKKVTNYGTFSNAVSAMTTIGTPSATVKKVTYDSMTPVSYTHLDVYKRQVQDCRRDPIAIL